MRHLEKTTGLYAEEFPIGQRLAFTAGWPVRLGFKTGVVSRKTKTQVVVRAGLVCLAFRPQELAEVIA